MAVLQQPVSHTNPFAQQIGDALAPAGTWIATVLDIKDEFGVPRQKFQSTEMETVDLTCFLFGFRDAQGVPHKVASKQMKISGNEKSALFGFLKGMLGKAPSYGWDYCSLRGHKCLLTVEHVQKRDGSGVYAGIAALSPLPAGMAVPAQAQTAPVAQPVPQSQVAPPSAPVAPPQPVPTAAVDEDSIPF
jgi:hypothetical protein